MQTHNRAFHLMAKPSSFHCNIKCEYCFYLEKETFLQQPQENLKNQRALSTRQDYMSLDVLEAYIKNYIDDNDSSQINFAWQGGEPTLLGIDFFRRAVALQQKYACGKQVNNSFQTNGIMLNDEWCRFFHEHHFLVGISVDGLQTVHDAYRVFNNHAPTFQRVAKAVRLLKTHHVDFNSLTVVNNQNWDKGRDTYLALKDLGITFIQFIPIVAVNKLSTKQQTTTDFSVPPHGYGTFLLDVFDEWIRHDVGSIFINEFDDLLAQWMGYPASSCIHAEACGNAMVIEANGDIYSCDHFVYPHYRLGNLMETPLRQLVQSDKQVQFGTDKYTTLTSICQSCDVRRFCHGGCPKDRIVALEDEPHKHNYLCASYRQFYRQTAPAMMRMRDILYSGRPAATIMQQF